MLRHASIPFKNECMEKQRRLYPSITTLMAFEAVAKYESFTEGARSLDLTQSAVSRQISALEAQLDCTLFDRNSRNVALTETGKTYAADIGQALELIQRASTRVLNESNQWSLNLGMLPTFGTRWLMPRIPRFVEMHPEITLSFTSHIGGINFTKVHLDAVIIHGKPSSPDNHYTLLMREKLVPVASKTLIPKAKEIDVDDLLKLPLLHMRSRPDAWAKWFEEQGTKNPTHNGAVFEHLSSLSQACIGGIGIALMPDFLIKRELEAGDLHIVGDSWEDDTAYYLAQPKKPKRKTNADVFRDWLLDDMARSDVSEG